MEGLIRKIRNRVYGVFFQEAYKQIDWKKGYEFLDKELQKVVRTAKGSKNCNRKKTLCRQISQSLVKRRRSRGLATTDLEQLGEDLLDFQTKADLETWLNSLTPH